MTWQNGRQLASIAKTGMSASYTYGMDGIRTAKTVNGTATEYYWQNGILQGQRTGNDSLPFLYNASGAAYGMICKTGETEAVYYYLFNAQGDVIALLDSAGNCVAEYAYDEWGKLLSVTGSLADTIGLLNPIRYRGYYYDSETGFYYLHSRYYDPEIGRFINADSLISTGTGAIGFNMYAYCNNNPVNMIDPTGTDAVDVILYLKNNPLPKANFFSSEFWNWVASMGKEASKPSLVTSGQLAAMGFKNVTSKSTFDLNLTLKTNNITSKVEITHFLSQCAYETNWGTWLTEIGSEAYFAGKAYGYKYRGAGYIQLTWDYNYKAFSQAMGDPEIYNQGANYVANNYAWSAAGWWWSNAGMGNRIAGGATIADVTRRVNGSAASAPKRQAYYDKIWGLW